MKIFDGITVRHDCKNHTLRLSKKHGAHCVLAYTGEISVSMPYCTQIGPMQGETSRGEEYRIANLFLRAYRDVRRGHYIKS